MNERWNLDRIYTGFDDPNFEADLGLLKEKVAAITAFSAELGTVDPVDGLCRGIVFEEEISETRIYSTVLGRTIRID